MNKFPQTIKSILLTTAIVASSMSVTLADGFKQRKGDDIYAALCASCHMPDGNGAIGAGMYPSFIKNEKLASKAYPQVVVLYGLNGMPALGGVLDDEQVANVINYVRQEFGKYNDDIVTAEEVSLLRISNCSPP